MPRSEPSANDSSPLPQSDLARLLEHHVLAGFPPDLALDLVLNELVVRAAGATHASAAALALLRGDEMVCRAATGVHAPDLGIPLNTRDGLSGACARSRAPQLCIDTESDPRVDPAISRILGIRSMLIVPVFDAVSESVTKDESDDGLHGEHGEHNRFQSSNSISEIRAPQLAGILEVLSPLPNAFSQSTQSLLEDFARECAHICHRAAHLRARPPEQSIPPDEDLIVSDTEPPPGESNLITAPAEFNGRATELILPESIADGSPPAHAHLRQPYENWTLALGALVILAAAIVSFMIGTRVGWIPAPQSASITPQTLPASVDSSPPASWAKSPAGAPAANSPQAKAAPKTFVKSPNDAPHSSSDELVVFEKGKVIFRMKPAPLEERASSAVQSTSSPSSAAGRAADSANSRVASHRAVPVANALSADAIALARTVWLAPAQAESRLLNRVEPDYPADALAAHRAGSVTLEVRVAEDGTVSSVRTLSGDPLLAAAAIQAVRNWRYQPYGPLGHPSPFQTDVTLNFTLPN